MPQVGNIAESSTQTGATIGAGLQQALAASLQTIREGSPDVVMETLIDLQATGDIIEEPEFEWTDEDNESQEELLDSEVELDDADDPFLDCWDDYKEETQAVGLFPSAGLDVKGEDLFVASSWRFVVTGSTCRFQQPGWRSWTPASAAGSQALSELDRRFNFLDKLAEWLTANRSQFLLDPNPFTLVEDAWEEFSAGKCMGRPEHFLQLTGFGKVCSETLFSRYRRSILLEWEDATLPVDFLFSNEVRRAWVLEVLRHASSDSGRSFEDLVAEFKDVKKPKAGVKRGRLASLHRDHLGWADLIRKANTLAGTKWADVVIDFENQKGGIR